MIVFVKDKVVWRESKEKEGEESRSKVENRSETVEIGDIAWVMGAVLLAITIALVT